jgi:LuxR family maltose regulon positive regulatory protein
VLHQRASQWYEREGLTEEAVRHALAAEDYDRAAHVIELAVPAIRRHRQEAMVHGWLTSLPDAVVRRSPVLSVFYGSMLLVSGDLDAVETRLDDAERGLGAVRDGRTPTGADTAELRTLPATIAMYRAAIAQARGDVAGTEEHAERALDLAGPDDHLARGGAAGFLGLAAWARGDVSGALGTFARAVKSLHSAGNLVDELSSTVVLADLWLAAGRPGTARRLYAGALQLAEAHGPPVARATADLHVGLSELDVEVGDLESAARHLLTAAAHLDRVAWTESRYRHFVAMSRVADAGGDLDRAVDLLDEAERLYRPGFFPDVRPIAAMRARTWIRQGRLAQAAGWARETGVSVTDAATYLREFEHLTLVRLLTAQHRVHPDTGATDESAPLLDRLLDAAETSGRAASSLEIRLLQALALEARGHRPQAVTAVAGALALAPEPGSYARLLLDEGAPMLNLLRQATHHGVVGDQVRRLLGLAAPAAARSPHRDEQAAPASASLSDRELQVLRLLDGELNGPEIARRLFVSHNTVRTHTKHIFTKLDVTSRRAAVLRARERGLL